MSKTKRFFPQLVVFTFPKEWECPSIEALEAFMQRQAFKPIGATQEESKGWVPPRGNEYDPLVESIDNQLIMKVRVQRKKVPTHAVKQMVEEKAKKIQEEFGRRPGKREKSQLKDEAILALLPTIFPTSKDILCWIDRDCGRIVFDAGSVNAVDDIVTMMVEMFNEMKAAIQLRLISTSTSPHAAMANWLINMESPAGFTVDRDLTLKSSDESKAAVKYTRHALDIDQVVEHVKNGKVPTQLAMTYDDRVSFVLTDSFVIKGVQCLDTVFESAGDSGDFDADIVLITEELRKMLDALVEELGGLFELGDASYGGQKASKAEEDQDD